ncbi:T9SS sorting signal type C domain-containing protein [Winogradskyella wichelsiae]|uniref:T9SS sorting signal type C domain-containing protein n=1 Tax=Winogradskyella wichelsiae TaxID=2697007 RepID=UPI0015CC4DFC|nr:T9SS sorting signal type C domain-containing protein [Winogradskyella wichelsiae]
MTTILSYLSSKKTITTFLLLFSAVSFYAQTVTNIFPTRVTTSSTITIIGEGFTDGDQSGITFSGGMGIGSQTFVSETEMTFKITADGSGDRIETLSITGVSSYSVSRTFNYIGPTSKSVSASSEIRVREVYTTWDQNEDGVNFWKSSDWNPSSTEAGKETWPNDSHELLGFKMNYGGNDIIFSTGVNNAFLETKLSALGVDVSATSTEYVSQEFKAYSTNGVSGKPNSNNYMGFADKIDDHEGSIVLNNAVRKTVYDVIIDGDGDLINGTGNGLELGTGIANFNNQADIRFYSGNGDVGAVNDGIPDLLITQMAQPGGSDVYYYADVDGNVVGKPVKLAFVNTNDTRLYQWRVDFYRLDYSTGSTFETAIPTTASFGNGQTRGFRMAALSLEDFGINVSTTAAAYENINSIDNINMGAGGSSDMSFMAYNKSAFDIKSPVIDKSPVSRFVCRFPSSEFVFTALGDIDGAPTGDSKELITYTWFKNYTELSETSNTFTIPAGLYSADLDDTSYRVRVANGYGAVDLPFTITEGGTPAYWDGTNWVLPTVYTDNNISVPDGDRSLRFTAVSNDLEVIGAIEGVEGCDCVVSAGQNVTIGEEYAMTLYNSLTVEEEVAATTVDGVAVDAIPAATFTIEDDASLVQINDVENSGEIKVKRALDASEINQYDYVYWASPVANFNISQISNTPTYQWSVNAGNTDSGVGNWVSAANSVMNPGEGYIVRVANAQLSGFTTEFYGEPNNGPFTIGVEKSDLYESMDYNNSSWNLIGNPYPSAIDAETFLTVNTNIEGRVDIWTHDTALFSTVGAADPFYDDFGVNYGNQYITFNSTGTSTPDPSNTFDGKIASGQAFFVRVEDTSTSPSSVNFTNAMRHDNEFAHDNSQFHRNSGENAGSTEKQLVWLSLANENNHAISTLIGYAEGATEGKDRLYDAYTNNEGFNLYSLITEDEKLVIQGLPLPFVDTNTVPLGVELTQSGIYTVAIGNVKGSLFEGERGQGIYLEDTYNNVVHDLRTAPYTFTGEQGIFNDRFILRYTESVTLSVEEISNTNTFAYINDAMFYVKSSTAIESVEIYDISGKQITNYTSNDNSDSFSTEFNFTKGVYVAAITLENGSIVTKKLIN